MTKRMTVALASCLALAACGGGSSGGNAAAGKTFSYGTATAYQATSVDYQVAGAATIATAPDAASAESLASVDSITSALLGSSGVATATSPVQRQALAAGARAASRQLTFGSSSSFDDPACVVTTSTSVTMKGCTVTVTGTGMTSKVQVDGTLSYTQATGVLAWNFTVSDVGTYSYSGQTASVAVNLHESGTLTVTATTIKGEMLAELGASGSSSSQSVSLAVSEAVNLDLTYAATCATGVTGGTLEAKRVWTDRGGASADVYPDRAAKITWTDCGVGSAAYSWK